MKSNLRKILKIAGLAGFIIALLINIKVSLDDPFSMVSESAIAQQTTSYYIKHKDDCSITISGEVDTVWGFRGLSFTIPASGSLTVLLSDYDVDCEINGGFICETFDCSQVIFTQEPI